MIRAYYDHLCDDETGACLNKDDELNWISVRTSEGYETYHDVLIAGISETNITFITSNGEIMEIAVDYIEDWEK